ncbi:MAG: 4Fe-4S dicluster domain-containing protein [Spirochaetaceae bacterium]|nr:MAG: 4Fe-4S dicluster domain-containing protein [Spirochaetaceae bacterium]
MISNTMAIRPSLKRSVAAGTLAEVLRCYQCKKCSSGCPVSFSMEILPHQAMRMIQLEAAGELLAANTAWVCSSCQTCSTRCPNDIDIAGVMDELRQLAATGRDTAETRTRLFHRLFLDEIRRYGRVHELGMIGKYKLLSGQWLSDIPMGIGMLLKGKLRILPRRIRGLRQLRTLFAKRTDS